MLITPGIMEDLDFDALKTLKLRDDDMILVSWPRSGCNWLWKLLRMIRLGSTDSDDVMKQTGMFEMNTTEKLDQLPSPRTFNTHLRFCHLPEEVERKKTKLVLVYRNPKDVAVSFFHLHSGGFWWEYSGKFENYLQLFCDGKVDDGSYAEYLNDWAAVVEKADVPVHVLTYEGLKENPVEELSRICRFLGIERDVSFLKTVIEECTIDKMRERSVAFWDTQLGIQNGATIFHRKGIVGDWKNHFTVAQNEQFNQYWSKAFTASRTFPIPGQD